jgi:MFS family permease
MSVATRAPREQARSGWAIFRQRDFALFSAVRVAAGLAQQMQTVAVGWLVYDLTHSALALGFVGLAGFLPAVALALITGHVADRFDRRLIVAACHALNAAAAAGLLAVALTGGGRVALIYVLVVFFGVARAFAGPASQALVPSLVPREQFAQAIAWNSSLWQASSIAGPALGGLLYAFGPAVVFASAGGLFALASGLAALIRPRSIEIRREPISRASLLAGITFIRSRPVILGAISLDLFAVLLGGATALLPIFAQDVLRIDAFGLGVMRAMPALGAGLMAVWLAHRPLTDRAGPRLFAAVAVFGLATVGFGLSTNVAFSLLCLVVLGAADMVSVVVRQTLVQAETPDAMRGRVAAVNTVFIGASNELGEFESGLLAALVGAVPAVVLGGVGTLGVAILWARLFPSLRRRDRLIEP